MAFPQELVSEIIQWNAGEDDEFWRYCRISRIWRAASLPFFKVFSEATFHSRRDFDHWNELFALSPTFIRYVRAVQFEPKENLEHIFQPLPTMTGVTKLVWNGFSGQVTCEMTPAAVAFLRSFPNLRSVSVFADVAGADHCKSFIGSCGSGLNSLYLSVRGKDTQNISSSQIIVSGLDLSHLESLYVVQGVICFDWMVDDVPVERTPSHLQTLDITSDPFTYPAVSRLLARNAHTLQKLTWEPRDFGDSPLSRPLPAHLPPLQALKTLTVGTFTLHKLRNPIQSLLSVSNLIEALHADNLAVCELCLWIGRRGDVAKLWKIATSYPWESFSSLLVGRCPRVEELVLNIFVGKHIKVSMGEAAFEMQVARRIRSSIWGGRKITVQWEP